MGTWPEDDRTITLWEPDSARYVNPISFREISAQLRQVTAPAHMQIAERRAKRTQQGP
jgi:hypothetical protein